MVANGGQVVSDSVPTGWQRAFNRGWGPQAGTLLAGLGLTAGAALLARGGTDPWEVPAAVGAGLLLTGLGVGYVRSVVRRQILVETMVAERTRALATSTEALAERTREIEEIRRVTEEIAGEPELEALLALVLRRGAELVSARAAVVYLWDARGGWLEPRARLGPRP